MRMGDRKYGEYWAAFYQFWDADSRTGCPRFSHTLKGEDLEAVETWPSGEATDAAADRHIGRLQALTARANQYRQRGLEKANQL